MSVFKRTSLCAVGLFALSFLILTDSAPAASEAPNAWKLLAGCAERVQELEAEMQTLRQQLREHREARGTGRTPSAGGRDNGQSRGLSTGQDCEVPFEISPEGIKHFKEQCVHDLETGSCDVPYVLDSRGVKSFKLACVQ